MTAQSWAPPPSAVNLYAQSSTFWETYISGRPKIPQSFFDHIFAYHAEHGGSFESVHEVGAGVGVHSGKLAARFQHVLVSDVVDENVKIARSRLAAESNARYSFLVSSLEECIDTVSGESMDLVFASTMMHFCENDAAVKAVYHQLKPGGTFAAGLYGTFALHEEKAQAIWCRIVSLISELIVDHFGFGRRAEMVLQNEASGLNSVGLPEEWFEPAKRFDYNYPTEDTLREMILPEKFGVKTISRIGKKDTMVRDVNRDWFEWNDIEGLKRMASTWPHDADNPTIIALWDELRGVIGDRKVEGAWMVSLLLATKK